MNGVEEINYRYLEKKTLGIIGVTVKEGQDLEGPEKAPEYLRSSGLFDVAKQLGWESVDHDDVDEKIVKEEEVEKMESCEKENHDHEFADLKHSAKIGLTCWNLNKKVSQTAKDKQFCLILGGDHGIATGSISGMKGVYSDLKVIWIDAHADCNLPQDSPSGNYHGMPVAHLLGWIPEKSVLGFDWFKPCLKPEDIVFIGLRDVDTAEKRNLKKHNIKCFSMDDVLKFGIGGVVQKAIDFLFQDGQHPLHISFDIDAVDPSVAYGTGTKARGGLLYREANYILREVAATGCLVSLDMVEINPLLDKPKEKFHGDNKFINGTETVSLGLELISSALGSTLL